MSFLLAVVIYLAAIALPTFLLYRFHSQSWYWHCLALAGSIGLGFYPVPSEFQGPLFDLIFGGVFIVLLVWGAGGIIFYNTHGHHEKHA